MYIHQIIGKDAESKIIFLKRRGVPINKFYFENELPLLGTTTATDFDIDHTF